MGVNPGKSNTKFHEMLHSKNIEILEGGSPMEAKTFRAGLSLCVPQVDTGRATGANPATVNLISPANNILKVLASFVIIFFEIVYTIHLRIILGNILLRICATTMWDTDQMFYQTRKIYIRKRRCPT